MIIEKQEMGISYLMKAKQGNFEFTQMYSKSIPIEKIESHFNIEATIKYEQWAEANG
jgi:hypothetical protein